MEFEKLLEPGKIGRMEVKNRVVQAPFHTRYASRDGSVTPRMLRYYKERAKGGTGLIIVEYSYIDTKASKASWCQLGVYDDGCIPGLATFAQIIKDNGSKACLQICHCGARKYLGTYPMVSPSRFQLVRPGVVPTELSIEEIREIVEAFGAAARRVRQAGFDMVEVHAGHSYLMANFLSPQTNRRADPYGGSLRNRMRFPLEVIETIRANIGGDYPLGVRISASEYTDDGITLDESKEFESVGEIATPAVKSIALI